MMQPGQWQAVMTSFARCQWDGAATGITRGQARDEHYRKECVMNRFLFFLLLMLAGGVMPAMAGQWTDTEIRSMPPYCAARLHKNSAQENHWRSVLGPDYLHTHHFCAAIGYINRYYAARTARSKTFNLQNAMGNLNYMIAHASPDYSLMPEVYLNRGQVHAFMKKDGAAIMDMLKAIELGPHLTRAYSMAADYYVKMNNKDKALSVVTEGVRRNPDSTVLKRLYGELGGQLPYPEPVAEQAPAPEAQAAQGKAVQPEIPLSVPVMSDSASTAEPATGDTPVTPKIGSPSNPWCRFCPPEPEPEK
jgi:tetratricopeptide (TPR) repeat protein